MGRPALPDEVKIRRGTYRPGRASAPANGLCEGASLRIQTAKNLLDSDALEIYTEAVFRIDHATPHVDGKHAMPDFGMLEDIELIEHAVDALLDSISASDSIRRALQLRSSDLYHLIIEQARAF